MKKKINRDIDLKQIGQRLKIVRKRLSLTLVKMEEIAGFSKSLIAAAEKGEKKPSSVYLFHLLKQFNVSSDYILLGEGDMFRDRRDESEEEKELEDFFSMMRNVKMVRYSVLGFYYEYMKRNEDLIKGFLDENEDEK